MSKEQCCNKDQRSRKGDIPDPSYFSSRLFWHFVGQKIQHHSCPAGISAPSASKYQRSEYFGYGIMYCCSLKHACEQIIPESLDLHIFVTYQPKIDKHVQTDKKLNNAPCVLIFFNIKLDMNFDYLFRSSYMPV